MNRYVLFGILTLALVIFAGAPANATTCITFTNFCDQIQFENAAGANLVGLWDTFCDGQLNSVLGRDTGSTFSAGTEPPTGGLSALFVFSNSSDTFDLDVTDGSSLIPVQDDSPWTSAPGPCAFAVGAEPGKRPSTSQDR